MFESLPLGRRSFRAQYTAAITMPPNIKPKTTNPTFSSLSTGVMQASKHDAMSTRTMIIA
jgi:hypothetical protein